MVLAGHLSNESPQVRKLLDRLADLSADPSTEQVLDRQRFERRSPQQLKLQHRLAAEVISQLVAAYQAGATVPEVAERFHVHRTTVSATWSVTVYPAVPTVAS